MTINLYVTAPLFLVMPMRTALYKSSQLLLLLLLLLLSYLAVDIERLGAARVLQASDSASLVELETNIPREIRASL